MLLGIDHIVVVVSDLGVARKNYERLGFTVVAGGRHPVGTHNSLISLADGSYIEIIAFYQPNPDHRWWQPLQKGEGLVDFCLRTDDLTGDTRKLRAAGVNIADPVPWARTRPDGYELKWVLSLARGDHRGVAPFLIEDVTPREERVPQKFDHKNGAAGIGAITVVVEELESLRRWYESALGQEGKAIRRDDIRAAGLRFSVSPHIFDFLKPIAAESPLAAWLKARGPSPYAATLKTKSGRLGPLDSSLTHGADLSFEQADG